MLPSGTKRVEMIDGRRVVTTSFRPMPKLDEAAALEWAWYQPTLEDAYEIAEWKAEAWEARHGHLATLPTNDEATINERVAFADTMRRAA